MVISNNNRISIGTTIGRLLTSPLKEVPLRNIARPYEALRFAAACFLAAFCWIMLSRFGNPVIVQNLLGQTASSESLSFYFFRFLFKCLYLCALPLLLLPLLAVTPRQCGLRSVVHLRTYTPYISLYLVMLPLLCMAATLPSFRHTYPYWRPAGESIAALSLWWLTWSLSFFAIEFFFRGFLVLGLSVWTGGAAVPIAAIPYCLIHIGKPFPEVAGSLVAGLVLGSLALRTRSIWPGFALHLAVGFTMDLTALAAEAVL